MSTEPRTAETALECIRAALRTVVGANNVARGRYPVPPMTPFAAIAGIAEESVQEPPKFWTRTATVDVDLWDGCAGASTDDRVWQSERLARDARDALETAHADIGNFLVRLEMFAVRSFALGSDSDMVPDGYCRAALVVTFVYREQGAE